MVRRESARQVGTAGLAVRAVVMDRHPTNQADHEHAWTKEKMRQILARRPSLAFVSCLVVRFRPSFTRNSSKSLKQQQSPKIDELWDDLDPYSPQFEFALKFDEDGLISR